MGENGILAEELIAKIRMLPAKSSPKYGAGGANHLQWDLDHGFTALRDDTGPRSVRVAADDLYKISEADIRAALSQYESQGAPGFGPSTTYDLLIEGEKRFPPKAIIGLAAARSMGRMLTPGDFIGGDESPSVRLLRQRGFEVVTKPRSVASFDATFSVGRADANPFVIVESRGPRRNTQYAEGLESILYSLSDMAAQIQAIRIESRPSMKYPRNERLLKLQSFRSPIDVRQVDRIDVLRLQIAAAAAAFGRQEGSPGGNPTKRIRIEFTVAAALDIRTIADLISEEKAASAAPPRSFQFHASEPSGPQGAAIRRAVSATKVERIHSDIQQSLYNELVKVYGRENVSAELRMASGRPADIVVRLAEGLAVYEIKTSPSPRDCVRQALGQLLEYSYWPGSVSIRELWIVGPRAIDEVTADYLDLLKQEFRLPLMYRRQGA